MGIWLDVTTAFPMCVEISCAPCTLDGATRCDSKTGTMGAFKVAKVCRLRSCGDFHSANTGTLGWLDTRCLSTVCKKMPIFLRAVAQIAREHFSFFVVFLQPLCCCQQETQAKALITCAVYLQTVLPCLCLSQM